MHFDAARSSFACCRKYIQNQCNTKVLKETFVPSNGSMNVALCLKFQLDPVVTSPLKKSQTHKRPPWFVNAKVFSLLPFIRSCWREIKQSVNLDIHFPLRSFFLAHACLGSVFTSPHLSPNSFLSYFLFHVHFHGSSVWASFGRFATDTFLFLTWASTAIPT